MPGNIGRGARERHGTPRERLAGDRPRTGDDERHPPADAERAEEHGFEELTSANAGDELTQKLSRSAQNPAGIVPDRETHDSSG